jgi:hypothetical protein
LQPKVSASFVKIRGDSGQKDIAAELIRAKLPDGAITAYKYRKKKEKKTTTKRANSKK